MKNNIFKNGKKQFNVLDAGIGEFVYLMLQFLIIEIFRTTIMLGVSYTSLFAEIASFAIEITFVVSVLIVSKIGKASVFSATKLTEKPKSSHILYTVLIALIAYLGFSSLTNTFIDFLNLVGYTSSSAGIVVDSWWKYLVYIVTMAAVPAFCEELLFRGLIYQGLRKWSKVGAIFISAALFMLMHGSPDQTVHQFILGIVLALVFNATGSIWCPMLLHFLNNFIALTLSFVYSQVSQSTTSEAVVEVEAVSYSPWVLLLFEFLTAIAVAAIAGLLIWLLVKSMGKQQKAKNAQMVDQPNSDGVNQPETVEQENSAKLKPSKQNSNTAAIILFVLSGFWVLFEWIKALITGILK